MAKFKTELILLANCDITPNIKVDDINLFVDTYPLVKKYSFNQGRLDKNCTNAMDEVTYVIKADIDDYNDLLNYNYANINFYSPEGTRFARQYYFVTNFSYNNDAKITITLSLDYLNTYQNYNYSPLSFIERQHLDRWKSPITKGNYVYLFKNIYPEDNNEYLNYLDSYTFHASTGNNKIDKNYWVKIIFNDENGLLTAYCHFWNPFRVEVAGEGGRIEEKTIKSFVSYTNESSGVPDKSKLNILLAHENVLDIQLIPYPPCRDLINVSSNSLIRNLDGNILNFMEYTLVADNTDVTFNFLVTNIEKYMNYDGEINLPSMFRQSYYLSFQSFLFNIICHEIDLISLRRLKNEVFLNGFFNTIENFKKEKKDKKIKNNLKRDITDFYLVNEPSVLNSSFLDLLFDYNGLQYFLNLEYLKLDENLSQIVDYYNNQVLDGHPIITIAVRTDYSLSNGIIFLIKDGLINYKTSVKTFAKVETNDIPRLTNRYLEYDIRKKVEQTSKVMSDYEEAEAIKAARQAQRAEANKKKPGFFQSVGNTIYDWGSWGFGKVGDAGSYVWKKVGNIIGKENRDNIARVGLAAISGRPWLMLTSTMRLLKEKDQNNMLNVRNSGNFEDILAANKELKLELKISQTPNISSLENDFYYHGNTINKYGSPNLNSRKYFNYFQGVPVLIQHPYSSNIIGELIKLHSEGIFIIHNNNNNWYFPQDYIENPEVSLLNAI